MNPTILLFSMIIFIVVSNYLTLTIGKEYYDNNSQCNIYDLFHQILPNLIKYHILIDLTGLLAFISLYFLANEELFYELFGKFILIMFIRAFTILITILPKDEQCDTQISWRSYLFGGCFDKIFSGHASFILLITLLYLRENIVNFTTFFGINAINIFLIISTRAHYSVDVLLAIFVTTTIFSIKTN